MKTIANQTQKFLLNCDIMKNISPNLLTGSYKASYLGSLCSLFLIAVTISIYLIFLSVQINRTNNINVIELKRDDLLFDQNNQLQFAILLSKNGKYLTFQEIQELFSIEIQYIEYEQQINYDKNLDESVKQIVNFSICEFSSSDEFNNLIKSKDELKELKQYFLCPQLNYKINKILNGLTNRKRNILRISLKPCNNCIQFPISTLNEYQLGILFKQEELKDNNFQQDSLKSSLSLWYNSNDNVYILILFYYLNRNFNFKPESQLQNDIEIDKIILTSREKCILSNDYTEVISQGYRIKQSLKKTFNLANKTNLYFSQDIMLSGLEIQYEQIRNNKLFIHLEIFSKSGGFLLIVFFLSIWFYKIYSNHYLIQDIINQNYEIPAKTFNEKNQRPLYSAQEVKDISQLHLDFKENEVKTNNNIEIKVDFVKYYLFQFIDKFNSIFRKNQNQFSKYQFFSQAKRQIYEDLTICSIMSSNYDLDKMKQVILNQEQIELFDCQYKIQLKSKKKKKFSDSYAIQFDSICADTKKLGFNQRNQNKMGNSISNNKFQQQQLIQKNENQVAEWKDQFIQFVSNRLYEEINKNNNQQLINTNKCSKDVSLINLIHLDADKRQTNSSQNSPIKIKAQQPKKDYNQPRRSLKESPSNFLSKNGFSSTIFFMNSRSPTSKQEQYKDSSPTTLYRQKRRAMMTLQSDRQQTNSIALNSPMNFEFSKQQSIYSPNQLQIKLNHAVSEQLNPFNDKFEQNEQTQMHNMLTFKQAAAEDLKFNSNNFTEEETQNIQEIQSDYQQQQNKNSSRVNEGDENKNPNNKNLNISVDRRSSTSNVLVDFTTYQQFIINDMVKQQQQQQQFLSKKRSNSLDIQMVSPLSKKSIRNCVQDDQQVDLIISLNCISPQGKLCRKQVSPHRSSDENFNCERRTVDSHNNQILITENNDQKKDNMICIFDESKRSNSPSKVDFKTPYESKKEISHLFMSTQNCSELEVLEKTKRPTIYKNNNQYFIQSLNDIQENILQDNLEETNQDKVVQKDQFVKSYAFSPSIKLKSLSQDKSQEKKLNEQQ